MKRTGLLCILLTLCLLLCASTVAMAMDLIPLDPVVALDSTVSLSLEPLAEDVNTADAATLYLGYDNKGFSYDQQQSWIPAAWQVVGYDGAGVAGKSGAATLLAKQSSREIAWTYPDRWLWLDFENNIPFLYWNLYAGEASCLQSRYLEADSFKMIRPYSNGISSSTMGINSTFWCLSSQEAFALHPELRKWEKDWWLRSPGLTDFHAPYVKSDGTLKYVGDLISDGNKKGVRSACYLDLSQVGLLTAADNSGHQEFGPMRETFSAETTGWKPAIRPASPHLFDIPARLESGPTVLATGTSEKLTLTFLHRDLSKYPETSFYNKITATLINDKNGQLLCYGNALEVVEENYESFDSEHRIDGYMAAKSALSLPAGLSEGTYTLSLYAEGWNDQYVCDHISYCLLEQTITVTDELRINVTQQPSDLAVVQGVADELSVDGELVGSAAGNHIGVSYQWYACDANKSWVTKLNGAIGRTYNIQQNLAPGDYYYFCRLNAATDSLSVHTDSELARVTVNGEYGAFTVENNEGDSLEGVSYVDGVLTFTQPGDFTVRQTAGVERPTTDRISVELQEELEEEAEFTLVLDGVNIQPAMVTGAWRDDTYDPFIGGLSVFNIVYYPDGHNGITLGPGDITLVVRGKNAISGGQGRTGYENWPTPGGSGLAWRKVDGATAFDPPVLTTGSLTVRGEGDNASLRLIGGKGGYDPTGGGLWSGGSGGAGVRSGELTVEGDVPLLLILQGGNGGDSFRTRSGAGGCGMGKALADIPCQLTVNGNQATVVISGGDSGLGDPKAIRASDIYHPHFFLDSEQETYSWAAEGAIKAADENYLIQSRENIDSELETLTKDEYGLAHSGYNYILVSPTEAPPGQPEPISQDYHAAFSLSLDGLTVSDSVWLGNISVKPESDADVDPAARAGEDYQGPVPWLVLEDSGLLLSEYTLGVTAMEGSEPLAESTSYYHYSLLRQRLDSMYDGDETLFTAKEQKAITTKSRKTILPSGKPADRDHELYGEHLFPLSLSEAYGYERNAFPLSTEYITTINGNSGQAVSAWWLRNMGSEKGFAWDYSTDPNMQAPYTDMQVPYDKELGIRPALQLNADQVLFTSPARDGKAEAGMESHLTLIPEVYEREWKLTLLDKSRDFSVEQSWISAVAGGGVELDYSGASVGNNEYISALLLGPYGKPLYYGRLEQPMQESGTVWLDAPAFLPTGDYQLLIFSEQRNSNQHSDYASAFCRLTLTIENAPSLLTMANGIDGFEAESGYDYIWFGEKTLAPDPFNEETTFEPAPIKWRVLDNMYSNDDTYGHSFLLSEYLLSWDDVKFNTIDSIEWQGSAAQAWCEDMAEDSFSAGELAAIKVTSCGEDDEKDRLQNDRLFFLSEYEARSWFYGFPNDDSRIAQNFDGAKLGWWLRTEDSENATYDGNNVLTAFADGQLGGSSVMFTMETDEQEETFYGTAAARPALNLRHEAILFTQAADNRNHVPFGPAVSYPAHEEWKLTLSDSNDFSDSTTLVGGNTTIYLGRGAELTVNHPALDSFSDANYTHLTALLTDANGQSLCYGSVNDDVTAERSTITIPTDLPLGQYQLSLYAEQWNKAYYTDYASGQPYTLTLTVDNRRSSSASDRDAKPGPSMANFKSESSRYTAGQYSDVLPTAWYSDDNEACVRQATLLGLMQGYGSGLFGPDDTLKCDEALKIACVIHNIYHGEGATFSQSQPWYQVYVDYALANNIIQPGDLSDYTAVCSRAQAAYLFAKALPEHELSAISSLTPPDVAAGDSYSREISLLYSAGVLQGNDSTGIFDADGAFIRAQAAAIASRICFPQQRIDK